MPYNWVLSVNNRQLILRQVSTTMYQTQKMAMTITIDTTTSARDLGNSHPMTRVTIKKPQGIMTSISTSVHLLCLWDDSRCYSQSSQVSWESVGKVWESAIGREGGAARWRGVAPLHWSAGVKPRCERHPLADKANPRTGVNTRCEAAAEAKHIPLDPSLLQGGPKILPSGERLYIILASWDYQCCMNNV